MLKIVRHGVLGFWGAIRKLSNIQKPVYVLLGKGEGRRGKGGKEGKEGEEGRERVGSSWALKTDSIGGQKQPKRFKIQIRLSGRGREGLTRGTGAHLGPGGGRAPSGAPRRLWQWL